MEESAVALFALIPLAIVFIVFLVEIVLVIAMWMAIIGLTIFWILMLVDIIRKDEKDFANENDKLMWIVIVALTSWVGAGIYYFMVKRKAN